MPRSAAARAALVFAAAGVLALSACTSPRGDAPEWSWTTEPSASPEVTTPEDAASPSASATATDGVTPAPADEEPAGVFESMRGLPNGIAEPPVETVAGAGWNEAGDALHVITYGSSSCPLVPKALTASDAMVEIELEAIGGAVCTMDYVPTTSTVPSPPGLDPTQAVTAVLGDLGQVTIPHAATPVSIGWLAATTA